MEGDFLVKKKREIQGKKKRGNSQKKKKEKTFHARRNGLV